MLQGRSDDNLQRLAKDYSKERANVGFLCHPPVPPQLTFLRGAAAAFQQSITVPGQSMQVIVSTFGENCLYLGMKGWSWKLTKAFLCLNRILRS